MSARDDNVRLVRLELDHVIDAIHTIEKVAGPPAGESLSYAITTAAERAAKLSALLDAESEATSALDLYGAVGERLDDVEALARLLATAACLDARTGGGLVDGEVLTGVARVIGRETEAAHEQLDLLWTSREREETRR